MKKYLFLLFALFLAGCAGVMTNGNRELTIEQVQQYAQQTMTARVADSQGNPSDQGSAQMLIRPVQQSTPAADSGLTIISTAEEEVGQITRPIINIPTAIPTSAPGGRRWITATGCWRGCMTRSGRGDPSS